MSYLLKRGAQARADWRDNFNRANENPLAQPWGIWGSIPNSARLENNRVVFGAANNWLNFGGWSYEHQPFTSYWGFEFILGANVGGSAAQTFRIVLNSPWSKVGTNFNNTFVLDIQYRIAIVGGPRVMGVTFDSFASVGNIIEEAPLPAAVFNGTPALFTVLVDNDQDVRVYLNGKLYLYLRIPGTHALGPGKRAANFANGITTEIQFEDFRLFDRDFDLTWSPTTVYDEFNRANTDGVIGPLWTKIGVNSGLRSNSYATINTTDGKRGIVLADPLPSGNQKVETILGGAKGPAVNTQSSICLRCNSATPSLWLSLNIFQDKIFIAKATGSFTSPTYTDLASDESMSLSDGMKMTFAVRDDFAWVEVDDDIVASVGGVDAHVPPTHTRAGLMVGRQSLVDSNSFNDFRAYVAA